MTGSSLGRHVANKAIKTVPAYQKFLKSKKRPRTAVTSQAGFESLPIMEKANYLRKHDLPELFPHRKFPPMAYASSGSSGQPTFWFRGDEQERIGADQHEKILAGGFGIRKKDSTLVVICFSMGVWVAGNYTLAAFREIARRGYSLTVVTPGLEKNDIFAALRTLSPKYKNLIIAGYPPFVMDVIVQAKHAGISLPKRTRVLTAGEKFSEEWRDQAAKLLDSKPTDIVSIYGCADVGMLGYETPLSIFIRRKARTDKVLYAELFGMEESAPALVQHDPSYIHFEAVSNELVFTVDSAIPLVRYNIHDVGSAMSSQDMASLLARRGILVPESLQGDSMPFVIKKGRTDVALTFYALNIYPDHLQRSLADRKLPKGLTGNYFAFNTNSKDQKTQRFHLDLEVEPRAKSTKRMISAIQAAVVKNLRAVNTEYRKLVDTIGDRAFPQIRLLPAGQESFSKPAHAGLLNMAGKKPRNVR